MKTKYIKGISMSVGSFMCVVLPALACIQTVMEPCGSKKLSATINTKNDGTITMSCTAPSQGHYWGVTTASRGDYSAAGASCGCWWNCYGSDPTGNYGGTIQY